MLAEAFSERVVAWLAETTLVAAVLSILVAWICRLTRPSPAFGHALWLVVLFKLLLPPVVQWPGELLPTLRHALHRDAAPSLAAAGGEGSETERLAGGATSRETDAAALRLLDEVSTFETGEGAAGDTAMPGVERAVPSDFAASALVTAAAMATDVTAADVTPAVAAVAGGPAAERGLDPWWRPLALWTFVLVAAGAVVFALLQIRWIVAFRRRVARAERAPEWLSRRVEDLSSRLGMRCPRVHLLAGSSVPFVWGLRRPGLYVPRARAESFRSAPWNGVLVHELAHLKRRDHWVGWLIVLAGTVWWWNPVYWCSRRQLRHKAEIACDAWAVWAYPRERRGYAESLIEFSSCLSGQALPSPAPGATSRARRTFERRLTMILRDSVRTRVSVVGLVAIGLCGLLTLPGWSQDRGSAESGTPATESAPAAGAPATGTSGSSATEGSSGLVVGDDELGEKLGENLELLVGEGDVASDDSAEPKRVETLERSVRKLEKMVQGSDRRLQKVEKALGEILEELRSRPRSMSPRPVDATGSARIPRTTTRSRRATPATLSSGGSDFPAPRIRSTSRTRSATPVGPTQPASSTGGTRSTGTRSTSGRRVPTTFPEESFRNAAKRPVNSRTRVGAATGGRASRSPLRLDAVPEVVRVETLQRVVYRLDVKQATALGEFLRGNVKGELSLSVAGNTLTITATAEVQETIKKFIKFLVEMNTAEPKAPAGGAPGSDF